MSVFSDPELAYLASERRLARIATVGRAAVVIDDLASMNPWRPRAIEVRGRAEAIEDPEAIIRIHPERIVSWGLETERSARTVTG